MLKSDKYSDALFKYKDLVHAYLDGIWKLSCRKRKARTAMYSWLATQLDLPVSDAHVAKFNIEMCKRAIDILRPKYIQLYGKDIITKKEDKYMYYMRKTIPVEGNFTLINDNSIYEYKLNISVYCRAKSLNDDGMIQNYDEIYDLVSNNLIKTYMQNSFEKIPTYENIAKWICDNILTAYKVEVDDLKMNVASYIEDKD